MVSGIDDRLHGLWTRPGQTLRARVNHRAREPPKVVLLKILPTNSTIVRKSQYHCDNNEVVECRFSVTKSKKQIYGKSHRRFALCCANTCKDAGFSSR